MTMEHVHEITKIDSCVQECQNIVRMEQKPAVWAMRAGSRPADVREEMGMADSAIARFVGCKTADIRLLRERFKVLPSFRMVDTCGGEFEAVSLYFAAPLRHGDGGEEQRTQDGRRSRFRPDGIGQGIEFDYCSVHCVWALKRAGFDTVIINAIRNGLHGSRYR